MPCLNCLLEVKRLGSVAASRLSSRQADGLVAWQPDQLSPLLFAFHAGRLSGGLGLRDFLR